MAETAPWITYRPELKVLDCTIRDGGLVNNHLFTDELVRAVYDTCVAAGIDYMEVGYKNSPKRSPRRRWALEALRRGRLESRVRRSRRRQNGPQALRDGRRRRQERLEASDRAAERKRVRHDPRRFLCPPGLRSGRDDRALPRAGLRNERQPDGGLQRRGRRDRHGAGAIAPTHAHDGHRRQLRPPVPRAGRPAVQEYAAMEGTGKEIGMHAHNNLQLAFANTIEAIILGANRVDATMGGLGRGAGNCHMELLLGFLRNPKFRLRPVIELLQNHIEPLKATLDWGPSVPYNITGQINMHPRAAISSWPSDESTTRQVLRPGRDRRVTIDKGS